MTAHSRTDPRTNLVQPLIQYAGASEERRRFGGCLFRPETPAGKESNWVPTNPKAGFEVLFRLYGPEKPFFDKTGSCRT